MSKENNNCNNSMVSDYKYEVRLNHIHKELLIHKENEFTIKIHNPKEFLSNNNSLDQTVNSALNLLLGNSATGVSG